MPTTEATSWTPLPESITGLSPETMQERISAAKARLGSDVLILGHHYQADDVIRHADATGDSFKLAQHAQEHRGAKYVVFCGVHFMAESADILTPGDVTVVLPDLGAGCSMADMAGIEDVEEAWDRLHEMGVDSIVPITYMNSTAAIKDFCGRNGGIVCTSSNAEKVLTWAFERGKRAMFFPDQHLGRNTAFAMGIGLEQMPLWDPGRRCERGRVPFQQADPVEGTLLGAPEIRCFPDRANAGSRSRPARPGSPGVQLRGRAGRGPGWLDRVHHQGNRGGRAGFEVGDRHGVPPRDPPRPPASGQGDLLRQRDPVRVLDHVPD
jgi:hypothetical protein